MQFNRISINPNIMRGKPCIKGTRITVDFILDQFAEGATFEYLLEGYAHITREDIQEALHYAGAVLSNQDVEEVYETNS
jgi:uncharacterized protein (DUF433 family)